MVNRCDSVDALMYAYCEFMRIKEENQMLEKNKDYVEMRVSSTDCAFTQNEPTSIYIDGHVYTPYMRLPDPGEFYILISKEKFDRLQAENDHYRELAKQWKDMKKELEECEKDYISERDKAEALQTENEQLKKKLQVPDPFAEYKELFEKLRSKEDVEKFEWTLNHICGGQASANGWMVTAKLWRRNYETLSKLVGFSSVEEIQDYLINEAEADTLHEAISKLKDQVKYTCDEWYSANSTNNSWKAAAECNSPKELIEKREALEKEIEVYSRTLNKWKEGTGCPSPSEAKTLIESGMSWHHAYNEIKEVNKKLADSIKAWQNVTGDATPEDYLAAVIKNTTKTVLSWEEITGFSTPEKCNSYIDTLEKKLEDIKDLIEED